jgi:hypothetical protein
MHSVVHSVSSPLTVRPEGLFAHIQHPLSSPQVVVFTAFMELTVSSNSQVVARVRAVQMAGFGNPGSEDGRSAASHQVFARADAAQMAVPAAIDS